MRSDTAAFFVLMMTCVYRDRWTRDDPRLRRLGDIVMLKWGITKDQVDDLIHEHHGRFDGSQLNIEKYAAQVNPRAYRRLFILCMDIMSAGEPIGEREGKVIARLREALKISDEDFERVMWFCRHRSNALNILWEKA